MSLEDRMYVERQRAAARKSSEIAAEFRTLADALADNARKLEALRYRSVAHPEDNEPTRPHILTDKVAMRIDLRDLHRVAVRLYGQAGAWERQALDLDEPR